MSREYAAYATKWQESRGRLYQEPPSATRTPFQRDRDRIIHCAAFRRLMHKTQVFISPKGDHFRTRLTHSIEVAQIGRSIARTFNVDEDLTEALALAHDLGHTPFGHTGEDALNELMQPFGGFDHNDQALRVLVLLEDRYIGFHGLNLSWEMLEGVVKHNGPLIGPHHPESDLPVTIRTYVKNHDLELASFAGIEAQIAAISDDIAYNHHDMDDGLRAGLFSIEQVSDLVPHVGDTFAEVRAEYPEVGDHLLISEVVRRMIGEMVADVVSETDRRLSEDKPGSAAALRNNHRTTVAFSGAMSEKERALKAFLFEHMYRAAQVNAERETAYVIIGDMFRHYMAAPSKLPQEWRRQAGKPYSGDCARVVADYIAGMTDRFAKSEAARIRELNEDK